MKLKNAERPTLEQLPEEETFYLEVQEYLDDLLYSIEDATLLGNEQIATNFGQIKDAIDEFKNTLDDVRNRNNVGSIWNVFSVLRNKLKKLLEGASQQNGEGYGMDSILEGYLFELEDIIYDRAIEIYKSSTDGRVKPEVGLTFFEIFAINEFETHGDITVYEYIHHIKRETYKIIFEPANFPDKNERRKMQKGFNKLFQNFYNSLFQKKTVDIALLFADYAHDLKKMFENRGNDNLVINGYLDQIYKIMSNFEFHTRKDREETIELVYNYGKTPERFKFPNIEKILNLKQRLLKLIEADGIIKNNEPIKNKLITIIKYVFKRLTENQHNIDFVLSFYNILTKCFHLVDMEHNRPSQYLESETFYQISEIFNELSDKLREIEMEYVKAALRHYKQVSEIVANLNASLNKMSYTNLPNSRYVDMHVKENVQQIVQEFFDNFFKFNKEGESVGPKKVVNLKRILEILELKLKAVFEDEWVASSLTEEDKIQLTKILEEIWDFGKIFMVSSVYEEVN